MRLIPTAIWMCSIFVFTALMINIVLPYLSWEWDVDFLQTKYHIVHLLHYRTSFYLHIFSSCIVLFVGAFLFSKSIIKNYSKLHRWAGKTYVLVLCLISAPSGMIMSFYANGGWMAKLSFLILCPVWWYCTYMGYKKIRIKKVREHEIWMIRSYALTLSAISLRFYQMLLSNHVFWDPDMQYIFVSWISWLGNLLIAELIIMKQSTKSKTAKLIFNSIKSETA